MAQTCLPRWVVSNSCRSSTMTLSDGFWQAKILARKGWGKNKESYYDETDAGVLNISANSLTNLIWANSSKYEQVFCSVSSKRVPCNCNCKYFGIIRLDRGSFACWPSSKKSITPSRQNRRVFAIVPWASRLSRDHSRDCRRHQISARQLMIWLKWNISCSIFTRDTEPCHMYIDARPP